MGLMHFSKTKLPLYITIAGIAPFVVLSVVVSMRWFSNQQAVVEILLTYAAVIISFLGGVHWGISVHHYSYSPRVANLLTIESVAPSLVAWGVLFYPDIHIQLLVMTLLFSFMWAVESLLYSEDLIPQWFFNLRCVVTPIVVVSLYVAYFGLV